MTLYSELSTAIERGHEPPVTGWVFDVLTDVVGGRLPVGMVRHPLGFLCVPAHRDGDVGACVHLWPDNWQRAAPTTSQTHCHSWDLLSWVAAGALHNRTIQVVDTGDSPTHRVFEVRSDPDGDLLVPTGRLVRAVVEKTETHRAGESYSLPAGRFHETLVPESADVVVTVALGRTRTGRADLSLGRPDTGAHRVTRLLCGRDEAVRAAEAGMAAVAPRSASGRVSPRATTRRPKRPGP